MKKSVFFGLLLLSGFGLQAQTAEKEIIVNTEKAVEKIKDTTNNGWKCKGNLIFLFNQSNFNNWAAGGENNLSGNLGINYDFNYKKKDITWDNKVIASYGLLRTKNSDFDKKTDDRFEFNSIFGKKATGQWFYSFFLNFKTQFAKGYVYSKNADGKEIRVQNTDLFSPAYLTFGPGMFWKKSDNLKVNLAPLTSKVTYVDRDFTTANEGYFGVQEGRSQRYELGFYASGYYKLNLMANISMENTLNLYSNYLEDPQNVDIDYTLAVVMRVNRYITTNLVVQTVYDDNAYWGFQTREIFGAGLNYGF